MRRTLLRFARRSVSPEKRGAHRSPESPAQLADTSQARPSIGSGSKESHPASIAPTQVGAAAAEPRSVIGSPLYSSSEATSSRVEPNNPDVDVLPSVEQEIPRPIPTETHLSEDHDEPRSETDGTPSVSLSDKGGGETVPSLWEIAYLRLVHKYPTVLEEYENRVRSMTARDEEGLDVDKELDMEQDLVHRHAEIHTLFDKAQDTLMDKDHDITEFADPSRKWDAQLRAGLVRVKTRELMQRAGQDPVVGIATCLAVESILRHGTWETEPRSTFVYILSNIEWYLSLPRLVPRDEDTRSDRSDTDTQEPNTVETSLINLFETILHVEILVANLPENDPAQDSTHPRSSTRVAYPAVNEFPNEADISNLENDFRKAFGGIDISPASRLPVLQLSTVDAVAAREMPSSLATNHDGETRDEFLETFDELDSSLPGVQPQEMDFLHALSEWAVQTPEYESWTRSESSRVLLVTGGPGSGKTALLRALTRHLQQPGSLLGTPTTVVSFFPGRRPRAKPRNVSLFVKNMIRQVLESQRSLSDILYAKVSATGRKHFDNPNDFFALSTLLYDMVQDGRFRETCFVVDEIGALSDEPSGDQEHPSSPGKDPRAGKWGVGDVVQLIRTTTRLSSRVRWIVSTCCEHLNIIPTQIIPACEGDMDSNFVDTGQSLEMVSKSLEEHDPSGGTASPDQSSGASETPIEKGSIAMRDGQREETEVRLNLSAPQNYPTGAMQVYTSMKVRGLAQDAHFRGKLEARVSELLSNRSTAYSPLWITMVCDIIKSSELSWNAPGIIRELPRDVSSLYRQIKASLDTYSQDDERYSKTILSTAMVAYRPLSVQELQSLVNLPDEVDIELVIKRMCFLFLEIVDGRVGFKHSAAKDYLVREAKEQRKVSQMHSDMVRQSLRVLSHHLLRDNKDDTTAMTTYASIYWMRHLSAANIDTEPDVIEEVNQFFRNRFLQWLESLELQGLLAQAQQHIQTLDSLMTLKTFGTDWVQGAGPLAYDEEAMVIRSLRQNIRTATWFLNFHYSLQGPKGFLPQHSLIFCPRLEELSSMLSVDKTPFGLSRVPNMGSASRDVDTCIRVLAGHDGPVLDCSYSPDGRLVASVSGFEDGIVRFWDPDTGEVQHLLTSNFENDIRQVVFSQKRGIMAITDFLSIQIRQIATGGLVAELYLSEKEPDERKLLTIAFSADEDSIRGFVTSGEVVSWPLPRDTTYCGVVDTMKTPVTVHVGEFFAGINSAQFSSDGSLLAWSSTEKEIILWNVIQSRLLHRLSGHRRKIYGLVFSSDSRILASGSSDCTVRVWDVDTGQIIAVLQTGDDMDEDLNCVALSPDGLRIAGGSYGTVRTWKATRSAPVDEHASREYVAENVMRGHRRSVSAVRFSPDGTRLLSSSDDGDLRIWRVSNISLDLEGYDAPTSQNSAEEESNLHHTQSISFVTFSPDSGLGASASFDGTIILWDTKTDKPIRKLSRGHSRAIKALVFSRDSKILLSAGNDQVVNIWDVDTGTVSVELEGHSDWIRSVALSPDENYVASASDDTTVRVWKIKDSLTMTDRNPLEPLVLKKSRVLSRHEDYVFSVAYSPDGRYLASGGDDGKVFIWDLSNEVEHSDTIQGGHMNQFDVLIRGDSKSEKRKHRGKKDDERPCAELHHHAPVSSLVFAPKDNGNLVSVDATGTIRVWTRRAGDGREAPRERDWQCKQSFERGELGRDASWCPRFLHFDPHHPRVLLSEFEPLLARSTSSAGSSYAPVIPSKPPSWSRYGVRECDDGQVWITRDYENLIFLPQKYRPSRSGPCTLQIRGQRIIIGCDSGQVIMFEFAEEDVKLQRIMSQLSVTSI